MCVSENTDDVTSVFFLFAALSLLRSSEEKAPVPQSKFMGDIEELAAGYERKLIEVSADHFYFAFLLFFKNKVWDWWENTTNIIDCHEDQTWIFCNQIDFFSTPVVL